MRFLNIIFFIGIINFLCSCSYKQNQILFEKKTTFNDTVTAAKAPSVSSYHIMPQDVLQIRNLQNIKYIVDEVPASAITANGSNSSQGQTYQVEEDGTVALPVIGHVQVSGLTRSQAAKQVEDLYRKKVLTDPIIELKVVNLKVTVLGEIKVQGNYPLIKDNTTLIDVIGQAGGLTTNADEKTVKIIRGGRQNQKVIYIDLNNMGSINDPNAILQNGDIIYIAQNKRATRSDNLASFSTVIQPLLILLNTALIIYTLTR